MKGETDGLEEEGHKRSLTWFLQYVDSIGKDSQLLWNEIKSIALKTICSIQPILKHYYSSLKSNDFSSGCCFEVLGFDIMISDTMKPYILEVNSSPSFGTDSQLDEEVKSGLVRDTLKLVDLTYQRKVQILKNEKELLRNRMMTGKRKKVNKRERLLQKCLLIKYAENKMFKEIGNFGCFEKVFGVDEYLNELQKKKYERVSSNYSESFLNHKFKIQTPLRNFSKEVLSKTAQREKHNSSQRRIPKDSFEIDRKKKFEYLIDDGECLGIENRAKIFEFIKYAELFEKKAQVSKLKRSDIATILIENLDNKNYFNYSIFDDNNFYQCSENKTNTKMNKLSKMKSNQTLIKNSNKLKKSKSNKNRILKKYKSCSLIKKEIRISLNRENEAFKRLPLLFKQ